MTQPSHLPARLGVPDAVHRPLPLKVAILTLVFFAASVSAAPFVAAESGDSLRAALASSRASACQALQSDPILEQAASLFVKSDDDWLNHTTRAVPVEIAAPSGDPSDPLPTLKGLGYEAKEGALLSGAAATEGDSIKALILQGFGPTRQGYARIPHCAYTTYGVSVGRNEAANLVLTVVVMASPALNS